MGANTEPDGGSEYNQSDDGMYQSEIPLDTTLYLLSHQTRRDIVGYFQTTDGTTAAVDDIVSHLADRDGEEPSHDDLYTQIHHVHLPKMDDAGLLDYDKRSGGLRYGPDPRLPEWLDFIEEHYDEEFTG